MGNFGRVLKITLRYRVTFIASLVFAFGVAVLWGGNIGAIFPVLQVAIQGQSLQDWMSGEIKHSDATVAELKATIARDQTKLAAAAENDRLSLRRAIQRNEAALSAEEHALGAYRKYYPLVDRYLPHNPFSTLALIVIGLTFGTLLKDIALVIHSVLVARLAELTTFELRKRFYRRTLRMDLATFTNDGTSDLMSRFTYDLSNISAGLNALFGKLVREPLKAVACLAGAAWINWRLLVLSMAIAPIAGFTIRWLAKMLKRANRRAMEEMSVIYAALEETFRGIKIVKAFTMERHERRRFHATGKQYFKKAMKIARYDALSHPLTELMGIFTISMVMLAGAWLVMQGETTLFGIRICDRPMSLAGLMVFYGLLAGVADPARKLSEVLSRIQQAAAASDRIFSLLDRQPTVRDPKRPIPLGRHSKELVFEHVGFGYLADQPVLEDVCLRIPFGETIAIVGPNGCGKSTLANLIPRFADPTSGMIRVDGIPLTDVRIRELRGQLGLVTQETLLFDDTVFNNIRYGSPWATREQVIEAAKKAYAHPFITEVLPQGYDTVVGQSGSRLSGGQRQRIALARAILRDPSIIILDEATSQVDLQSEQLIQTALEEFVLHRTAVIITHRLSILALAHRIVVMEAGRIVDCGTHQELMGRCELYSRLCHLQAMDRTTADNSSNVASPKAA